MKKKEYWIWKTMNSGKKMLILCKNKKQYDEWIKKGGKGKIEIVETKFRLRF